MDFTQNIGQIVLVCCFVPSLMLLVLAIFAVWNFRRFLGALIQMTPPDTIQLHRQYEALKTAHPNDTQAQLVRRIVNRYALRQGIMGALTSLGGFIVLPLGIVIDLTYSAHSNNALSFFIAQVYGIQNADQALNFGQLLVLKRQKLSLNELVMWQEQYIGLAYQQFVRWVLRKTIAKLIPGAGAVIGFVVNYSSAQLFGTLADQYYRGHANTVSSTNRSLQ